MKSKLPVLKNILHVDPDLDYIDHYKYKFSVMYTRVNKDIIYGILMNKINEKK